ncbi:MAG TPA: bifunctional aspartate kinase/homoserine dehydrogenase I [Thermoanaerobaculia bacterium]|jgi:aspartokinase/homoserine dehydrogenase 1|nr:bifunctional aspartate kinase/homoserine dehydrogenase I [Thermoanaerobaculia bacterium]
MPRSLSRSLAVEVVHKFGGASLGDAGALRNALSIVEAGPRSAVVVVSAFAGVTDALLSLVRELSRGNDTAVRRTARALARKHEATARAVTSDSKERERLLKRVRDAFAELAALTGAPLMLRELSPRSVDRLIAFGEDLAARIFSAGLTSRGLASEYVSAMDLVATDARAGQASPDLVSTDRRVRVRLRPILRRGGIPVVPGFIGADPEGRVTTLGRGGSDLTATLVGRALGARAVFLWKDVPGFLTADPSVVPDARIIPQLNVREAAELAYYGAKVLHPRALIPVGRRVPVFVRPFARPDRPGTEISGRRTLGRYPVKALSAISGQALVTVTGNGMLGVPGIAARTFEALHRENISVSLISQASSEHSICLGVPASAAGHARTSLLDSFREEITRREIDGVEVRDGLATISVVGLGMAGTPGIAARVFTALAQGKINVIAIAQGSSELSISFVVEEASAGEAERRIHEAFQLSKIGGGSAIPSERADVVLLGFGQVGRTLADLIAKESRRAGLRLVAVIDRGGYVFRPGGLSSRDVAGLSRLKAASRSVSESSRGVRAPATQAISTLAEHALSRPVLVDVTADNTSALLERSIAQGFDLVLANKRPLSGSHEKGERIESAARASGRRLRFEATVGAGLPILDTYRKLVESGDQVSKIEGCLSGTLGFLLSEVEKGRPFSRSLRLAIEQGYTEPDPRDDLSGADVGRKALILGRLLGFRGEPEDVEVESLVPTRLQKLSLARFLERLEELDPDWNERVARARARDRVLRYIASVTRRRVRVKLAEVAPGTPFAGLTGSDNQVAFTTRRYRSNPLVIQGPGAGLAVTAAGIFNDVAELAGG